jgi:hypothetical protein
LADAAGLRTVPLRTIFASPFAVPPRFVTIDCPSLTAAAPRLWGAGKGEASVQSTQEKGPAGAGPTQLSGTTLEDNEVHGKAA